MTIRVRLALSFGLTLGLFCLNLVAYFATSASKDGSLQRLQGAARRRLEFGSIEHDIQGRWQEISVLSELPFTAGQAAEVERRLVRLADRLTRIVPSEEAARARAERILGGQRTLQATWRRGTTGPAQEAVAVMLRELDALDASEGRHMADEAARLTDLTALMHRLSVLMFGLSLAAATLIAVAFSRDLTSALRAMQQGAEAIGAGDLSHRIARTSQDELGSLARAFNDMAGRLSHAMQDVHEARARAEHASRAKTAFLSNMSHELRTPLLAVQGYAELIREEAERLGAEQIATDSAQIESAGRHLATLLNEVLDLSKIESGKLTLVIEEVDVPRLVESVTATVKPLIARNTNTLSARVEPGASLMRGDEMKIRQVLLNILGNAAKFTTSGDITLTVTRAAGSRGDTIRFVVQDTGIGMTPEQTGRIFEEFEQAEPTTARAYGGSGLGLAICKKLSRLMGGDVEVASELARGTTFTITLPVTPRERVEECDDASQSSVVDRGMPESEPALARPQS